MGMSVTAEGTGKGKPRQLVEPNRNHVVQQLEVPAMSSGPLRLHSPASSGGASSAASQLLRWLLALAAPGEAPSPASVIYATKINFVSSLTSTSRRNLVISAHAEITCVNFLLRLYTAT